MAQRPLPIEAFALTPEEQQRLKDAPFQPGPLGWTMFAAAVHDQLLESYAEGEIDFRDLLSVMRSCSLACSMNERMGFLALTAERGLAIQPKPRKRKRPPYPRWLRSSAATLVQMLHEGHPGEMAAPNTLNDWTTPILETAIAWLVTLGLADRDKPIRPRTLYSWYLEHKKATADTPPFPTKTE